MSLSPLCLHSVHCASAPVHIYGTSRPLTAGFPPLPPRHWLSTAALVSHNVCFSEYHLPPGSQSISWPFLEHPIKPDSSYLYFSVFLTLNSQDTDLDLSSELWHKPLKKHVDPTQIWRNCPPRLSQGLRNMPSCCTKMDEDISSKSTRSGDVSHEEAVSMVHDYFAIYKC